MTGTETKRKATIVKVGRYYDHHPASDGGPLAEGFSIMGGDYPGVHVTEQGEWRLGGWTLPELRAMADAHGTLNP